MSGRCGTGQSRKDVARPRSSSSPASCCLIWGAWSSSSRRRRSSSAQAGAACVSWHVAGHRPRSRPTPPCRRGSSRRVAGPCPWEAGTRCGERWGRQTSSLRTAPATCCRPSPRSSRASVTGESSLSCTARARASRPARSSTTGCSARSSSDSSRGRRCDGRCPSRCHAPEWPEPAVATGSPPRTCPTRSASLPPSHRTVHCSTTSPSGSSGWAGCIPRRIRCTPSPSSSGCGRRARRRSTSTGKGFSRRSSSSLRASGRGCACRAAGRGTGSSTFRPRRTSASRPRCGMRRRSRSSSRSHAGSPSSRQVSATRRGITSRRRSAGTASSPPMSTRRPRHSSSWRVRTSVTATSSPRTGQAELVSLVQATASSTSDQVTSLRTGLVTDVSESMP
jgi:hypothetical protein